MKHAFCLSILLATLVLPQPAHADADAWTDFEKLNQKFYLIDKEQKGPISCHIRSSELDDFMQKIPIVAEMVADQIDRFSVTLKPDGDISFVTPRTKMSFGTIDDVEAVNKGLSETVALVEKGVWHLLKGTITPKKEEISDLALSTKDGKTHITMTAIDMDGSKVKFDVTDSGDSDVAKQIMDKETVDIEDKFIKLDGKYTLGTQTSHSSSTGGRVDSLLKVEYQQVGKAKTWFPSRIIDDGHFGPKLKPVHAVVSLTDCTGP